MKQIQCSLGIKPAPMSTTVNSNCMCQGNLNVTHTHSLSLSLCTYTLYNTYVIISTSECVVTRFRFSLQTLLTKSMNSLHFLIDFLSEWFITQTSTRGGGESSGHGRSLRGPNASVAGHNPF